MTTVPKTLDNLPPLTPTEIADLEAHEKVIEVGRDTFVEVGLALLAVRERKLYRCTHFTFAAYAADKWGISDRHSRRLMAAAMVVEITGPIGPVSESVARELAPLAEDSGRLTKVWAEAQRLAGDAAPTACDVITARKQVKPDPPEVSSVMLTLRTHDGTEVPYPKPNSKATFNSTNEHISWAAWSWNPVTGCLHGCDYCYARELATKSSFAAAYPAGFTPLFHPERLDAPANTPVPQDAATDPRRGRVFVCSMADLYGRWVPQGWIDEVHAACIGNPQWDYLMLTKFPERYVGLDLPRTAWLGTSVDEQKRVRIAEKAFVQIPRDDVRVRWLSLEPLREPLEFRDLSMFDWVVIGSQTQTVQPTGIVPAFAPPFEWVARIVAQAREAGCRVHLKPNLQGSGPQSPGMDLPQESPDLRSAEVTP